MDKVEMTNAQILLQTLQVKYFIKRYGQVFQIFYLYLLSCPMSLKRLCKFCHQIYLGLVLV